MTDIIHGSPLTTDSGLTIKPRRLSLAASAARTRKRYAAERRFRLIGLAAVCTALGLLGLLLFTIVAQGYTAFVQSTIRLPVELSAEEIDPDGAGDPAVLARANYAGLMNDALYRMFPEVEERRERRALRGLVSSGAAIDLQRQVMANPDLVGTTQELDLLAWTTSTSSSRASSTATPPRAIAGSRIRSSSGSISSTRKAGSRLPSTPGCSPTAIPASRRWPASGGRWSAPPG
jgi:hypothetical protein